MRSLSLSHIHFLTHTSKFPLFSLSLSHSAGSCFHSTSLHFAYLIITQNLILPPTNFILYFNHPLCLFTSSSSSPSFNHLISSKLLPSASVLDFDRMELDHPRPLNPAMTFDEVSMERSKSFVNALQELKNLRPQLYSAAEYCEKSYLHSEQKQMVFDNLKEYAVRALVNAVDHLGTVAYKLTDLLEQQTLDVSTMDLKVSTLNQQLLTCQVYTDKEGLRQQQLLALIPRHHKHYILPNSVNKKVHFSPHIQTDARLNLFQARSRSHPSGTPASKTLSWHLASETKSTLKGTSHTSTNTEDPKISSKTIGVFQLLDNEERIQMKPSAAQVHLPNGGLASSTDVQTIGVTRKEAMEGSKPLTAFRSFDNLNRHETAYTPTRSKSVLSAFFVKPKTPKLKASSYVS